MRRFVIQNRHKIWMKTLSSSALICFILYIIIRGFSYDFPMSWKEEFFFFFKILFTGCSLMVLAMTGSAFVYKTFLKIRRDKKGA